MTETAEATPSEKTKKEKWTNHLKKRLTKLLESGDYDRQRLRRGLVRQATIVSIGEHDLIVDLGAKRDGIITPTDLDLIDDQEYVEKLEVGDQIPVVILKTWGHQDGVLVSLNKGLQQEDWLRAKEMIETEEVVEVEVMDVNRGGLLVEFGRLQGFVPNSHLTSIPRGLRGKRLREAKSNLVGGKISVVVIEVNQRRRRLIMSERQAQAHKREELFEELAEGDVRTGIVRNLVDFGAFVDLGGADGLIHISELDWTHVDRPGDVLSVGEEVEVYVIDVDRERKRIALSRKRLMPDPWFTVMETLHEGSIVEGTVTGIESFGAFVDIGDGVEGLVHVSNMPKSGTIPPNLEVGSRVTVSVLNIDEWKKRISLELRSLDAKGTDEGTEE